MSGLQTATAVAVTMGIACSVLSVFVVLRRWAFIGEGIAHAGFGGAGVAWVLALLVPSGVLFHSPAGIYLTAAVFCLGVGLAIAAVTRRPDVHPDTAIGIFLVTSLAWGFTASHIFARVRGVLSPPEFGEYLFGQMGALTPGYAVAAAAICMAVLLVVFLMAKEILAYTWDPQLAELSGVRSGVVHYSLIFMLAVLIVIGMRMMGSVLITALLVLPGATALLLSRRLRTVLVISIAVGVIGALAGPLLHSRFRYIPEGPLIVLALVAQFVIAWLWRRLTPARGIE